LVEKGLLPDTLTLKVYEKLGLTDRQYEHFRKPFKENERIDKILWLIGQYPEKERNEEGVRFLDSKIKKFLEEKRPWKGPRGTEKLRRLGVPESTD
jgi:hypothetical protein